MDLSSSLIGKTLTELLSQQSFKSGFICKTYAEKITHLSYATQGFEFVFQKQVLTSIFVYHDAVKFASCSLTYPFKGLSTTKDVVDLLGDSSEKGGGLRKGKIFISYSNLGLQFQFNTIDWNNFKATIEYICIYEGNEKKTKCSTCLKEGISYSCERECGLVEYCSKKCYGDHISFHLIGCKKFLQDK